jgi:hypothetical protein
MYLRGKPILASTNLFVTGHLEHTKSHRIALRRRRRHLRPRILRRLHLLLHRFTSSIRPSLRLED